MDKKFDSTNPILKETIEKLEKADAEIWSQVAENLGKVNRERSEVNLSDIERVAKENSTIVVPGKVLGSGQITKELNIAAFKASNSAKKQINEKGNFMFIQDLLKQNPEGTDVKLVK